MIIRSLELSDFRNYQSLSLSLDPGTNIFYGDNAQGKTNILEAIFLVCTTKSHKGARDKEIIRFGQKEAHIRASVDKEGLLMRVDMHLRAARAKGVAIDGLRMKRASDFLQKLGAHIVLFSPEDLYVIKGGPAGRRRFLDLELCQTDAAYMDALSLYLKTLSQRAAVLKDARERGGAEEMAPLLDVYDKTAVESGKQIIRARKRFVEEIGQILQQTHLRLTGEREHIRLSYLPDCEAEDLEERMRLNRTKDLMTLQTNAGPHRDELSFFVKSQEKDAALIDLRKYGSQGQQRTAALSLKLAQIALVKEALQLSPVLLLDDVLSELDENRQRQLLENIGGIQTIITCTGLDEFVDSRLTINKIFHVTNGEVSAEN